MRESRAVGQAVWTGSLAFGLVNVPVKLYPATQPKDVRFHLIDAETGGRVRYRRFVEDVATPEPEPFEAAETRNAEPPNRSGDASPREREVAFEELARGYEVEPGRFVRLEREEIERAR